VIHKEKFRTASARNVGIEVARRVFMVSDGVVMKDSYICIE
jgi:hypothetical protein